MFATTVERVRESEIESESERERRELKIESPQILKGLLISTVHIALSVADTITTYKLASVSLN